MSVALKQFPVPELAGPDRVRRRCRITGPLGGNRVVQLPIGEQLPRIC